jgi:hypothetical protein
MYPQEYFLFTILDKDFQQLIVKNVGITYRQEGFLFKIHHRTTQQ